MTHGEFLLSCKDLETYIDACEQSELKEFGETLLYLTELMTDLKSEEFTNSLKNEIISLLSHFKNNSKIVIKTVEIKYDEKVLEWKK